MKKTVFLAAALLIGAGSFAQEEEKVYLPEAEDWAVSIDATPFLNYFGNFIGGNGLNTAPTWDFLANDFRITGKYFKTEDMALRASLRLGFGSNSATNMVADRANIANPSWPETEPMVENNAKFGRTNVGVSGGVEYRKGKGRLQGYYGAELGVSVSSTKDTYTYGNELTASTAAVPVNVTGADDFTGGVLGTSILNGVDGVGNPYQGRVTEHNSGLGFGVGLRGFIGAEYFIIPKLSIGGEFGWGLVFNTSGASSTTHEARGTQFGATADAVETVTVEGDKTSGFSVDSDNLNQVFGTAGSLRLTFHF
jgi:hypothetical protein